MLRTTEVPYVYSRDGIFYFTRRIPNDLKGYYRCPRLVLSLRTKSLRAAKTKSTTLAAQLDEEWMTLRWRRDDSPLRRYLSAEAFEAREFSNAPLMSKAKTHSQPGHYFVLQYYRFRSIIGCSSSHAFVRITPS